MDFSLAMPGSSGQLGTPPRRPVRPARTTARRPGPAGAAAAAPRTATATARTPRRTIAARQSGCAGADIRRSAPAGSGRGPRTHGPAGPHTSGRSIGGLRMVAPPARNNWAGRPP
ncbi:hypothetical protein GCM10009757_49250 [Streptomyces cheonanensis]|uniref:Uncharacterized protein n=1 Tax=Streptomyces cheonanensis TaxID=312720 RepID=A0ABP5H4F9_9ACTN